MREVASIAVRCRGMLLWLRRFDNGKATLPGGHLNPNEKPLNGAIRELYEETGIKASKEDLEFLGSGDTGRVIVHSFLYNTPEMPEVNFSNDPDGEGIGCVWAKDIPDRPHVPNERNVTLALLGIVEGKELKLEKLTKMAIKDLAPGEPTENEHGEEVHDYSHLLPNKWKSRLSLHIGTNRANDVVLASLKDEDNSEVGNVKGLIEKDRTGAKTIQPHSELHEDYHGEGLGRSMYEALYAHALHKMGINKVSGGNHSEDAGRVHESLARKHGMNYVPAAKASNYGLTRKPYEYMIKNENEEQAYGAKVQKKLRDLNAAMFPNSTSDKEVYELWDLFRDEESLKEMYKQHPELTKDIAIVAANTFGARDDTLYQKGSKEDILEYIKHGNDDFHRNKPAMLRRGNRPELVKDIIDAWPTGRENAIKQHLHSRDIHPEVMKEVLEDRLGENKHDYSVDTSDISGYMDRKEVTPEEALKIAAVNKPQLMQHPKIPVEEAFKYARSNPTRIERLHPDLNSKQIEDIVDNIDGGQIGQMKLEAQRSVAYHSNTPSHVLRQLTSSPPEPEPFDPDSVDQDYFDNYLSDYHPAIQGLNEAVDKANETAKTNPKQAIEDLRNHLNEIPPRLGNFRIPPGADFEELSNKADDIRGYLEKVYSHEWNQHKNSEEQAWDEQQNDWAEPDHDAIAAAASHPNLDRETALKLATGDGHDEAKIGALHNPNLNVEDLQPFTDTRQDSDTRQAASHAIAMEDPDTYHTKIEGKQKLDIPDVSTEKVRQLRDKVDALGGVVHHKKVLDSVPASIKPFLDSKGQLHSSKLQEAIDSVPKTSYWVGEAPKKWEGMQRHSAAPSDVFHVNYTSDHVKKMKEAGVWKTFKQIQSFITRPDLANHPVGPTTIGWVRHTGTDPDEQVHNAKGNKGIHIDEVQSDLGQNRLTDELKGLGVHVPEEHMSKIKNILWGNRKTAQDLTAEAFIHHHRQNPENIGKPMHWPSHEMKEIHGSPMDTYKRLPKELGFAEKAGQYGDLETQSDPSTQGKPTHTSKITKFENDPFFNQAEHTHKPLMDSVIARLSTNGPPVNHSYLAVEVLYHLLNDKTWIPYSINHENTGHWYLKNKKGEILDPARGSFEGKVPYQDGRPKRLLSSKPSKRALELISQVKADMAAQNDPTLAKGILGALAGMALAGSSPAIPQTHEAKAAQFEQAVSKAPKWTPEGLHPDLIPLAHLESSFGQNMAHKPNTKGEYHTAFGPLGLKPSTAHEEWTKTSKLKSLYPGLEDPKVFMDKLKSDWRFHNLVATSHFLRLKQRHGSPEKAAFAWRFGSGHASGVPEDTISKDPYVMKYRNLSASTGIKKAEDTGIAVKHFSRTPGLKELKPEFQGTGMVGAEKARSKRIPRTYYYLHNAQPEGVVTAGAAHMYEGKLPSGTKLYDLGEDTLGINRPSWKSSKYGMEYQVPDLNQVEKKIAKLGYHGYHNYGVPGALAYFHPLKVRHVVRKPSK